MVNAVFGKTMENIRNHMDFKLVCSEKKYEKLIAKCTFLDRTIYNEHVIGMHFQKTKIVLNKAVYVGMCILDLSKLHMYNFHYSIMKPLFGNNIDLCYMDTDSFIYLLKCKSKYDYLKQVSIHLDTSNYCHNHEMFSLENKGVLGKFKDESQGKTITRFVGLRAKMYALEIENENEIKKLKGITRSILKHVSFNDYVNCLNDDITTYTKNNLIRSVKHNIYSICTNKKTLDANDDKRHLLADGIFTLPHGHIRLRGREERGSNVQQVKYKRIELV